MPGVIGLDKTHGVLEEGWRARTADYPLGLSWSPDGETLSVIDAGGGLYAFDGASGRPRWAVPDAHRGGAMALAHHPRAPRLASSGPDGRVVLRDTLTGAVICTLTSPDPWIEHLAWSPDGRWLAAASGRHVRVWDEEGAPLWCSEAHPSTVSAIGWSAADELATACYGQVAFWRVPTGELRETLRWKGSLISMALSPCGEIVACGSQDHSVHFWRRATGEDSMMSGYASKPAALAFDAAGQLLATGGGESVTVWSFLNGGPEGTQPSELSLHPASITALRFTHRDTILASGGREGGVVIWQLDEDGDGGPIGGAITASAIEALAWRPDDLALAAIDASGGVTTWQVQW
jgi:WD40 repeat protein